MTVRYLHAEQYLHAEAVLRAFAAAGKRHLLLTGGRGTGKSTLAGALAGMLGASAGITTTAVPRSCVMMRDNRSGVSAIVGKYDPDLPGNERKMTAVPGGFAEFGAALLRRCAEMDDEWISVDEIGYLEHGCTAYSDALAALMEKKRLLAVVRKQALPDCSALTRREDVFLLDLDQPFGADAVGCVIMASGMGVRFGGNKLMADFRGMPMIGRVLDCTEGIFTRRVVVTRHSTVADFCAQRGVDTVLHDLPDRSDTVRLGLEALGEVSSCVFCPGDQPLLQADTVAALVMASAVLPQRMLRAAYGDTVGAPVLFPAWTFPQLRTLPAGKGGGYVLRQYPEAVCTVSVGDPMELADADTKDALRMLAEYPL